MRLDKFLAHLGYGSRKTVKQLLKQKIVTINDQIVIDASFNVLNTDIVKVGDVILHYEEFVYILYYKPKGEICSKELGGTKNIYESINHPQISELFSVGRLDKDTTGALLITNDGVLDHKLRSLKYHVDKVYEVTLKQPFNVQYINQIQNGIWLNADEQCAPAKITIIDDYHIQLILQEGKYHQVKRMMIACDNEVVELHRSQFSFLTLDNLQVGEYRSLTKTEIERLKL